MQECCKCGCEIKGNGLRNRIKTVGKETVYTWIIRHIRQLFSLLIYGFDKPEIEDYKELCDDCYEKLQTWLYTKE